MSKKAWSPPAGRIPYLDGLRAFSITTVVLGHASLFIPWLSTRVGTAFGVVFANSSFGVRVFFVLSGFLITTLLLNELEATGRISIKGFYERRIARIFPAFYTYLLTILILMLSHHIDVRWGDLANAATYTWNYSWLWYPPGRVAGEVLGLFWTLSLEEQFYLVWPACLILLGRRWAERLVIACVIFLPFVRIACYFLFPSTRGQLMMMFHTGSDQLLWGAGCYRQGTRIPVPRCDTLALRTGCVCRRSDSRGEGEEAVSSAHPLDAVYFSCVLRPMVARRPRRSCAEDT